MTKLTAKTITFDQIRNLRAEANTAGDRVQAVICSIGLGEDEPVADQHEFEDRYGGGGFDERERRQIMAIGSPEEAWQVCADAINAAINAATEHS